MTGGSPSPVGIRSASRQSPSPSKGSFFATKGETTTNALVAETQSEVSQGFRIYALECLKLTTHLTGDEPPGEWSRGSYN